MKRITANALSMMALVLLFTAASYAQDVQVTVPFEFTAGDTTFPAGEYRLAVAENHVLTLSNRDLGSAVFTMTAYSISSLTCIVRLSPPLKQKKPGKNPGTAFRFCTPTKFSSAA